MSTDDRDAALLAELARYRTGPRFDREVAYHPRAYVFARCVPPGGATLILATHAADALRHYEAFLHLDPRWDAGYWDLTMGGRVQLVVCDRALPPAGGELLTGYIPAGIDPGPGRLLARVHARPVPTGPGVPPGIWRETDLAVLWDAPDPPPGPDEPDRWPTPAFWLRGAPGVVGDEDPAGLRSEYRLEPWTVGGDAYGLYYLADPGAETRERAG